MIPCKDVVKISKEKTALVIPNAIQICTRDEKYNFTSFAARDKTFLVLEHVLKCTAEDQVARALSVHYLTFSYAFTTIRSYVHCTHY